MPTAPKPASRLLLVAAFAAVASSAGLQWAGLLAQTEAARQRASRGSLQEFSAVLHSYQVAPTGRKPELAKQLTNLAEALTQKARGESVASASRRVGALASYEVRERSRESELQDRLRAEVRDLVSRADSMESVALQRAVLLGTINQVILCIGAVLSGLVLFKARRAHSPF